MNIVKSIVLLVLLSISTLASAKTIEMDVNGLVCAFCAQGIEKTFKTFPATASVYVSLENRIVAVELKQGLDIEDAQLKKAIKDAGYALVAIRRTDASLDSIRRRVSRHE